MLSDPHCLTCQTIILEAEAEGAASSLPIVPSLFALAQPSPYLCRPHLATRLSRSRWRVN
ncbi:hypothetical protein A4R35_07275 [Thermogemmatispora tikiterensis]|uniref:Uncharacterized protein n=1 Tax=Thermogemmatispora tikiterensis TaxID=1825093 RepID=A0A328VGV0_9CHLR|nr:hypothetical protein A4R35_07275 [Thermogemmatispora tikiterensis]